MTLRNVYESLLIELNKVQAPSLLIDDFIYLFNKSVQQYINKRYNLFEINQQLTDDLRVLTITKKFEGNDLIKPDINDPVFGSNYTIQLPDDYLHILNCVCEFNRMKPLQCDSYNIIQQGANKLNTNQWPHVIDNFYLKPSYKRPYYYIINVTDPIPSSLYSISDDTKKTITVGEGTRYGNATIPKMQIKCGKEDKYKLHAVYIDYLRTPQYLSFTQDQLDDITDTTQVVEFPDYVIYEIINTMVANVLENHNDPRIQTHPVVNSTIPQK